MIWIRDQNQSHKSNIHFSLGQIVKHKLYGFRGFVVAWDPKPRMDVSNWDGLADVEHPNEKPFYHIYPDVNDSISAAVSNTASSSILVVACIAAAKSCKLFEAASV